MKRAICHACEKVVEVYSEDRDVPLKHSKKIVLARALLCVHCKIVVGVSKLLGLPREPD